MVALIIVDDDVVDLDAIEQHGKAASPILFAHGAASRLTLTAGTVDLGEGDGVGTDTVILRFETVEIAREVWESEAHQTVLSARLAATRPRVAMLVDTVDGA